MLKEYEEVEEWTPEELKSWVENCKANNENYEYIIVVMKTDTRKGTQTIILKHKYIGNVGVSGLGFDSNEEDLLEEFYDRIREGKVPYVDETFSYHFHYGRNYKLKNQRIFFSPRAKEFLKDTFDVDRFLECWDKIEDREATKEHLQFALELHITEKDIDEKEKEIRNIEKAVAVRFDIDFNWYGMEYKEKFIEHNPYKELTAQQIYDKLQQARAESKGLEDKKGLLETELDKIFENIPTTRCYPIEYEDFSNIEIPFITV